MLGLGGRYASSVPDSLLVPRIARLILSTVAINFNNSMTPELEKEIRILGLLDSLAYELGDNSALAEKMAARMECTQGGRKLRQVIMNRRGELSYYSEDYAMALKPYLDNIDNANPVLFLRSSFSNIAVRTIYLRVYQAWLWLIDHHPDKAKYLELRSRYVIQQNKHDVRIAAKRTAPAELFGKVQSDAYDDVLPIQNKIDEFLRKEMTQEMEIFEQKNMSLSPESMDLILDSLTGLDGIIAKVEPNCVKILRKKV